MCRATGRQHDAETGRKGVSASRATDGRWMQQRLQRGGRREGASGLWWAAMRARAVEVALLLGVSLVGSVINKAEAAEGAACRGWDCGCLSASKVVMEDGEGEWPNREDENCS